MCLFEGFVDKAFAVCDPNELVGPYYLVSAGDSSPGQVMSVDPSRKGKNRQEILTPRPVEIIQNWSPSSDMIVSNLGGKAGDSENDGRMILHMTARRGPNHGAVAEMSIGLEANVISSPDKVVVSFDEDLLAGVTSMWAILDPSGSIFFVLSLVLETRLFRLRLSGDEVDLETEFDEENCGVRMHELTLAVTIFREGQYVLVTNTTVQLLCSDGSTLKEHSKITIGDGIMSTITSAAVMSSESLILLACHIERRFVLQLVVVPPVVGDNSQEAEVQLGSTFILSSEPTAVTIFRLGLRTYFVASTADGVLHFLGRNDEDILETLLSTTPWEAEEIGPLNVCESLIALHHPKQSDPGGLHDTCLLVCGMRDGSISTIEIRKNAVDDLHNGVRVNENGSEDQLAEDRLHISPKQTLTLGLTPVTLAAGDWNRPNSGFAHCGSTKCLLTFNSSQQSGLDVDEIISDLRTHPSASAIPVRSVSSLLTVPGSPGYHLSNAFVFIKGNTFTFTNLQTDRKPVPWFLGVQGTPNRLLYSDHLSALVIASTKIELEHGGRPPRVEWQGMRKLYAQIEFISTNEPLKEDGSPVSLGTFKFWPGERIYSMAYLTFKDSKRNKYRYLFVGTGLRDASGIESGTLTILNVKKLEDGFDVRVMKRSEFSEPVYSIAKLKDHDITFTTGRMLRVQRLVMETARYVHRSS